MRKLVIIPLVFTLGACHNLPFLSTPKCDAPDVKELLHKLTAENLYDLFPQTRQMAAIEQQGQILQFIMSDGKNKGEKLTTTIDLTHHRPVDKKLEFKKIICRADLSVEVGGSKMEGIIVPYTAQDVGNDEIYVEVGTET